MATVSGGLKCYTCGSEAGEQDQLPPQNLFPSPRPGDLFCAPICADCHSATSEDDELFQVLVISSHDLSDARVAAVWAPTLRGLQRPEARPRRMVHELLPTLASSLAKRRACGSTGRAKQEMDRLVRGMYWHRFGTRLPDGAYVADFAMDPNLADLDEGTTGVLQDSPLFETDDRVYQCRMVACADDPAATVFIRRCYERTEFGTWTLSDGLEENTDAGP